jgi:hypothetical protein
MAREEGAVRADAPPTLPAWREDGASKGAFAPEAGAVADLETGPEAGSEPGPEEDAEAAFDALALRVLRFQARANPVYGALVRNQGATPEVLEHWTRFPLVPARAFRDAPPWTGALPGAPQAVFHTSGTTASRPGERGEHRVRELALYHASLLPPALRYLHLRPPPPEAPDRAHAEPAAEPHARPRARPRAGQDGSRLPPLLRCRVVALLPHPDRARHASLAQMAGVLHRHMDDGGGGFLVEDDGALDPAGVVEALASAAADGVPVLLLTTAFALVHTLDHLGSRRLRLPPGSRMMETGGFKGRSRQVPRRELYESASRALALPLQAMVNEYGMTELLSQFWEPALLEGDEGDPERRRHLAPPWVRTRILDPGTLVPVTPGTPGLLAHLDLANLFSASPLLTEDLGVWIPGPGPGLPHGFRVLGRSAGTPPRGCSLTLEAWMETRT